MNILLKIILVLGIGLAVVVFGLGLIFLSTLLLRRLGFIPACYKLVDYSREDIYVRSGRKRRMIKWREIESICSYSFANWSSRRTSCPIELQLRSGEVYTLGRLTGDTACLLASFYDILLENLKFDIHDVNELKFSHPVSWIRFKNKNLRRLRLFFVLFASLWAAFWIGGIIYTGGAVLRIASTYFFALFIPISCIIVLFRAQRLEREHKGLVWLQVNGDSLSFQDESGKSQKQRMSDVIRWDLDKTNGALFFSDGTKLNDLEKLRYWPLLREYLLSKLEPGERHS